MDSTGMANLPSQQGGIAVIKRLLLAILTFAVGCVGDAPDGGLKQVPRNRTVILD